MHPYACPAELLGGQETSFPVHATLITLPGSPAAVVFKFVILPFPLDGMSAK
jgi:hypothetical protein